MMSMSAGIVLTEQSGDVLEPGDERRRHVDAGNEHEREMGKHRHVRGLRLCARTARLAERDAVEPKEETGQGDQNAEDEDDREQRSAREGRRHYQKFADEDAERRQAGDRYNPEDQTPAENRMGHSEAAHVGDALRALDLRNMADGEKDRRLGER